MRRSELINGIISLGGPSGKRRGFLLIINYNNILQLIQGILLNMLASTKRKQTLRKCANEQITILAVLFASIRFRVVGSLYLYLLTVILTLTLLK